MRFLVEDDLRGNGCFIERDTLRYRRLGIHQPGFGSFACGGLKSDVSDDGVPVCRLAGIECTGMENDSGKLDMVDIGSVIARNVGR